jgi:hypothetical protein
MLKLEEQHKLYEKMLDEIMRRHVEEDKLPLMLGKLSVKHTYNNYRVVTMPS